MKGMAVSHAETPLAANRSRRVEVAYVPSEARCDKCGEPPFWAFPRLGDPCPCGGKLIAVKL